MRSEVALMDRAVIVEHRRWAEPCSHGSRPLIPVRGVDSLHPSIQSVVLLPAPGTIRTNRPQIRLLMVCWLYAQMSRLIAADVSPGWAGNRRIKAGTMSRESDTCMHLQIRDVYCQKPPSALPHGANLLWGRIAAGRRRPPANRHRPRLARHGDDRTPSRRSRRAGGGARRRADPPRTAALREREGGADALVPGGCRAGAQGHAGPHAAPAGQWACCL